MGGIQPCHPMIACAPLPPAPSPTTSRTPHSVEHRPRGILLGGIYEQARSKLQSLQSLFRNVFETHGRLQELSVLLLELFLLFSRNKGSSCINNTSTLLTCGASWAPKAASKSSPEAPRVQVASNKVERFQEPASPRCQERDFSSLLR